MRTSLRVFAAALSALLAAAFLTVVVPATPAHALDGVSVITVSSPTVAENVASGTLAFTVNVNPAPNVPLDTISADIVAVGGSAVADVDYDGTPSTLAHVVWNPGDPATKNISLPGIILNDAFKEPDETFKLHIANPQSASAGADGTVTITNDDGGPIPAFVVSSISPAASAPEGNAGTNVRTVTVELQNPTAQAASIDYATADGSATSDGGDHGLKDFVAITTQTLHFPANATAPTEGPISITINGDTVAEPNESLVVNFAKNNNGSLPASAPTVTLENDDGDPPGDAADVPKLAISPIPDKTEGDSSTSNQTVTVTISPTSAQAVTVDYATSDGTAVASTDTTGDYTKTTGTLKFAPNQPSQTFDVPVVGDTADELDEIYHVTLSKPINASIATGTADAKILNDDFGQITTVPGRTGGPHVRLFGASASDLGGFFAYDSSLTSGLHVARGDFFKADGTIGADGVDEIVTAPGQFPPKGNISTRPLVRIFATDGTQRASFFAFDPNFNGGVYLAAGNIDGDPSNGDELVVGAGPGGGPHVRVLKVNQAGTDVTAIGSFFPYPGFGGGVRVAVANEAGDAKDEIITAPGPGGGPHVKVNSLNPDGSATTVASFFAYDSSFSGGVYVAATNNHIVTGAGAGGGPHVRAFDGAGSMQSEFFAYDAGFSGGVSVGLGNLDNELNPEIVTGAGAGGGPHVKVFKLDGSQPFGGGFYAYDPAFAGGVEVAVSVANS